MAVQHTPPKAKKPAFEGQEDEEPGTVHLVAWKLKIDNEEKIVWANSNQNEYLNSPLTTADQKTQFLKRLLEEQQEAEAEEAAAKPEDLQYPPNSPTPTEESLELIRTRASKIEETLAGQQNHNAEVKKPHPDVNQDENNACRDRQHEFEHRTKTHLAVPAKRFIRAVNTLKFQLNREKFADVISRQFGDELLNEVYNLYAKVEEAREFCEEVLSEEERLQYGNYYLQNKFEDVMECERIHRKYFEEEAENKQRRQATQPPKSQAQPPHGMHPPMYTSTPFNQPPPRAQFVPPHSQPGAQHGHYSQQQQFRTQFGTAQGQQGQQQEYGQQQRYGQQQSYGQQQEYGHQQQPPNPPPGFKIFEDQGSRIPTPTAPSGMEARHHTRFKLNEELLLVDKFDATQPRAYMAFRAQWENFYEKMKLGQRSNLDLYYALLKVLGGSAKDLVQTKYPNDQSYAQAVKKLDDLFFNPANLLRDMVQNLLKGQKMADNYDSLLGGMNKLWDAWNDLNQADLNKEQLKGLLFIAATEKNLSEESWKCWLDVQNDIRFKQNPMECFEISAYLGSINQAMLNAQKRKNALGGKEHPPNAPPKTNKSGRQQSTLYGAYNATIDQKNQSKAKVQKQARGPNDTCVFCKTTPHKYQLYCPQLKNMKPNEIYGIMTNRNIECQMCLGLGHRTRDCPALQDNLLKKCKIMEENQECGRNHCRYLHKSKSPNGATDQTPKPKQE